MAKLDKVLQKDMLAIMLRDKNAVSELRRIIEPDLFTSKPYRFACRTIYNHYEKYHGELPSKKALILEIKSKIKDEDQREQFKDKILPLLTRQVDSATFLKEEIKGWAEKQQFGKLLEKAAKFGEEEQLDKAKQLLKSSFIFDISRQDFKIYSLLEEWKTRQRERKHEARTKDFKLIRTNLGKLDDYMIVKTKQSTMGLIMGTSGVGKSIFSVNFGVYGLMSHCKVAHFVFENTARQTLGRYDSRLVKYPYIDLTYYKWNKQDLAIANIMMRSLKHKYKEALKIIHAPLETVSVADIESLLKEIEISSGWIPDLIVYDSGDHLLPSKDRESYRLGVKQVYTDIKRQSEIRDIPIWSTTHAKASARGTRLRQESFSESYDKARLSDIVLTISQTQEQEDDRQCEFWLDKCRDNEGKYGIMLDLLFRYMTLKYAGEIDFSEQEEGGTE